MLIDIGSLDRGGAERQIVDLAAGLARRGHSCALAVHKSVDAFGERLEMDGVLVQALGRMRKYDARILPDLLALYRGYRPDVVLAVEFNATLWGRLAAVMLGYPCAIAEHASKDRFPASVIAANRALAPFTRATVACARAQVPRLVAAGSRAGSMVVINNGVDVVEFSPDNARVEEFRAMAGIPRNAFVIGLVAAHRVEKRHDRFIRLVEDVRALGTDAWGCMVGGGPLLDANRRMAARSRAAERIVITGPIEDMPAAYNAMDVIVLVSDSETFPLSMLEAQACARVVVSMDVGGVCETFVPGETGILVGEGDEQAMAVAVTELAGDRERLRITGEAGRDWVETNLSLDMMIDRYERLLERVAAGRRA